MTEESTATSIARIERALARIEAAARNGATANDGDERYDQLRMRAQAALASLETVINKAEGAR